MMPAVTDVLGIQSWKTNGYLIEDVARVGFLHKTWRTLDPTYGEGTFWTRWRPANRKLVACDLNLAKSPLGRSVDFRELPWRARSFQCVVYDPPYKLNGTPTHPLDATYGVSTATRWQDRMTLIFEGLTECARVLDKGFLLVKCADQVCSGKVRWQTDLVRDHAQELGLGKVDRFDMLSYRKQPGGRDQKHARHNSSTLLVFQKGFKS